MTKAVFGYETYGYMYFFNESNAADIITPHVSLQSQLFLELRLSKLMFCQTESIISLIHPDNSELHKTELCPRGKAKEWIEAGKTTPLPSYESGKEREMRIKQFEEGGWTGPLNW
jgi:hypothetical protein